ncbi:MAG TPA: alpha-xylosidase [Abditibacteriaceae bacterium]|jgi:alpha-D-xyloside xylohydrolase
MKFTNGYWEMRPGMTPYNPAHVHDVSVEADALTIYAPFKHVNNRGATLNLGMLTVRFSSPLPNVIRVQMVHHKGVQPQKPAFELHAHAAPGVEVHDEADAATLTSGQLSVRVDKNDWRVEFKEGDRIVTSSGRRAMGLVEDLEGQRYIHEQLSLSVGECVYGLGERFTAFVKNGQVVDMWNEDGGTSSDIAYKNIPFYLTNRGYGVFVNHPERVSFEVASEKVERVQFSVPGESLDYFVIYGPSPKEVLSRYTELTGRPALPPAWSFGLWLSTSFTTNYDEDTVTSFIQGMADRDLPLHVFHFDCFWMREFHWCDFEWDRRVFPDPEAMLQRLKARGLRICVWINPYIAQRSLLFDEGMANGFLLKRPNGDVWQWDMWQAGMGMVDFTNPDACRWYGDKLRDLVDMGVDCFKTDFGERIPTDVAYFDSSDPVKMHNYYAQLYNKVVFDVLKEKRGESEAVLFARSATAGGQQFPVHWGGDCTATFESMAESLRGGLSLCLSGFGFWSHDIGGFEQTASADVYKRWCAFGLLSSHSRLHGSTSYRVPWLYDDEAVDVLRFFTKLKCRLMPYLFAAAGEAHELGIPTMRAMMLEFPDDPGCSTLDRQYMLGSSLLVAPIFSSDNVVDYYLPPGRWTNFLSGAVVEGGRWVREQHDFLSVPLLARPNSIIAVGANESEADYDYARDVTLHVFELEDGARATTRVSTSRAEVALTAEAHRAGDTVTVTVLGSSQPWRVLLRGVTEVGSVEGGSAQSDELGTSLTPQQGANSLTIRLRSN